MPLQRQLTLSHLAVTILSITILFIGSLIGYGLYLRSDLPAVRAADWAIYYADDYYETVILDGWSPQAFVEFNLLPVGETPEIDDWLILVDENGFIIGSNYTSLYPIGQRIGAALPPNTYAYEFSHPDETLSDRWAEGGEATYTNYDGRHMALSPLFDEFGNWRGWVFLHLGDEDIRGLQQQLIRNGLILTTGLALVALIVAGLMGLLLSRRFGSRLEALGTASTQFAEGDRKARVEIQGKDEISQLGVRYNEMANTIEKQIGDLQDLAETNARLAVEAEGLARVEERNRLARELHDAIKQQLFGLNLALGSLSPLIKSKPDKAHERIKQMIGQTQTIQTELDSIIHQLRPASLSDQGLITALGKLTKEWEAQVGVSVSLTHQHARPLSLEIEQAIYRLIQEALQNTGKHALATQVDISLDYTQHSLEIDYMDNGVGFDIETQTGGGYGLSNMRSRVEALEGRFSISSKPGKGCQINALFRIA